MRVYVKYEFGPVILLSIDSTREYIMEHPTGLIDNVTSTTTFEELEQLAHLYRRIGYAEGYGLQQVYAALCKARDAASEKQENEND